MDSLPSYKNLKCTVSAHNGQQIGAICVHPDCEQPIRFACIKCIMKDHCNHADSLLDIDDLFSGN